MWTYRQSTGEWFDAADRLICTGYAGGNCGRHPEGINNPDMQNLIDIGPLPRGLYVIGQPIFGSHMGPVAYPLIPDPMNQMFGRGGFYAHLDTLDRRHGSDGCTALFKRSDLLSIGESKDRYVAVVL